MRVSVDVWMWEVVLVFSPGSGPVSSQSWLVLDSVSNVL